MAYKFLVHHVGDSVGVAVEDIKAGEEVQGVFLDDDSTTVVVAKAAVPLGHKIALNDVPKEDSIIEYQEKIGVATENIKKGDYVHTHNLKTARW
ncbi:MAG: UxaA family hydrolase [Sporolactobacillus sp.]|jgi:(2R)-sulfolactate sulfo-lyase subunit alpha|nr:UxaA family hydrolase [Sporolactobacillus sp.]